MESLKTCTHPWQAVASMLGLAHLSSLRYNGLVSVIEVHKDKYLQMISSTMEKLFESLKGCNERQAAAHNTLNKAEGFAELHEAFGGDESFLRYHWLFLMVKKNRIQIAVNSVVRYIFFYCCQTRKKWNGNQHSYPHMFGCSSAHLISERCIWYGFSLTHIILLGNSQSRCWKPWSLLDHRIGAVMNGSHFFHTSLFWRNISLQTIEVTTSPSHYGGGARELPTRSRACKHSHTKEGKCCSNGVFDNSINQFLTAFKCFTDNF